MKRANQMGRIKSIMDKSISEREYERGKSAMASEFDNLLDEFLSSSSDLRSFANEFRERFCEYIPSFGESEPTKYELKFNYIDTVEHRGIKVDIFDDDYGQQYYFYLNGRSYGCGAFNPAYQEYARWEIDRMLDHIMDSSDFGDEYIGASLDYTDNGHTNASLRYRGEEVYTFSLNENRPLGEDAEQIKERCRAELDKFMETEFGKKKEGNDGQI